MAPAPLTIRAANPAESAALSALARRSRAHWGYSREFLEACRAERTVDGARPCGKRESASIPGRMLPRFEIDLAVEVPP